MGSKLIKINHSSEIGAFVFIGTKSRENEKKECFEKIGQKGEQINVTQIQLINIEFTQEDIIKELADSRGERSELKAQFQKEMDKLSKSGVKAELNPKYDFVEKLNKQSKTVEVEPLI